MTGDGLRTAGDERRFERSDPEMATAVVVRLEFLPLGILLKGYSRKEMRSCYKYPQMDG